ncbi:MAG: hypothetical protein PHT19_04500 [Methylococcus sp.]|nr:hypothetical protein [Methylococcus sp.]
MSGAKSGMRQRLSTAGIALAACWFPTGVWGITQEEWDRKNECRDLKNLEQRMTVEEYIAKCANGVASSDGCRINIEKACVNGAEVDLIGGGGLGTLFDINLKRYGFDPRFSNGLSKNDFSDPSQMYNKISLPNGKMTQLCHKIEGQTENETQGLTGSSLPSGDYTIESVPAIVKPNERIGAMTLHWKIIVSGSSRQVEMELRTINQTDRQAVLDGKSAPYRVVSDSLHKAVLALFVSNLVKCKKERLLMEQILFEVFVMAIRQVFLRKVKKCFYRLNNSGSKPTLAWMPLNSAPNLLAYSK